MGLIVAKSGLALAVDYNEATTILHGAFDRVDLSTFGGGAIVQFLTPQGSWAPQDGLLIRKGMFRSLPGLMDVYGPTGPRGVRLKRQTATTAATVDLELWGLD